MPNDANYLDVTLLGKEYRVACPPEEHDALLDAVAYVDEKMHDGIDTVEDLLDFVSKQKALPEDSQKALPEDSQ